LQFVYKKLLGYGVKKKYDLDAAAIILNKPIKWFLYPHIRPICLPPGGNIQSFTNKPAIVTGWGFKGTSKLANELQKGEITVLPNERCNDASIYGEKFTESMLCAGVVDGSVDACEGDSGGPLGKPLQFMGFENNVRKRFLLLIFSR
jgi:Trypsin